MGRVLPIAAACFLNATGTYLFRNPADSGCLPYGAYLLFLKAVFCLLWNIPSNPHPSCFRSLKKPVREVMEFFVAALMVELLMLDFWCPLQCKFTTFISTIPDHVHDASTLIGASSYGLSLFFLLCAMHSCRVVDLRLLKRGVRVFGKDIEKRIKKYAKRLVSSVHKHGLRHSLQSRKHSSDTHLYLSTDSESN
ncbi:hypothetical protein PPYR_05221 [Photinus pyralis]|uniref:Uncharacterized protein n=1 Tax=Photinus pyralis TaxID=7054 RepID=A0A5N4AU61_PHOPY|nr:uncharacterized protein LOC116165896 isoform X3 [Photinus pyralis]KAB0800867.1 hypothetical protein PPYR_05221 [Photinus pyralis]